MGLEHHFKLLIFIILRGKAFRIFSSSFNSPSIILTIVLGKYLTHFNKLYCNPVNKKHDSLGFIATRIYE